MISASLAGARLQRVKDTMVNRSSLVFARIRAHPPIMVPKWAKSQVHKVRRLDRSDGLFTERLIGSGAETVC